MNVRRNGRMVPAYQVTVPLTSEERDHLKRLAKRLDLSMGETIARALAELDEQRRLLEKGKAS